MKILGLIVGVLGIVMLGSAPSVATKVKASTLLKQHNKEIKQNTQQAKQNDAQLKKMAKALQEMNKKLNAVQRQQGHHKIRLERMQKHFKTWKEKQKERFKGRKDNVKKQVANLRARLDRLTERVNKNARWRKRSGKPASQAIVPQVVPQQPVVQPAPAVAQPVVQQPVVQPAAPVVQAAPVTPQPVVQPAPVAQPVVQQVAPVAPQVVAQPAPVAQPVVQQPVVQQAAPATPQVVAQPAPAAAPPDPEDVEDEEEVSYNLPQDNQPYGREKGYPFPRAYAGYNQASQIRAEQERRLVQYPNRQNYGQGYPYYADRGDVFQQVSPQQQGVNYPYQQQAYQSRGDSAIVHAPVPLSSPTSEYQQKRRYY